MHLNNPVAAALLCNCPNDFDASSVFSDKASCFDFSPFIDRIIISRLLSYPFFSLVSLFPLATIVIPRWSFFLYTDTTATSLYRDRLDSV